MGIKNSVDPYLVLHCFQKMIGSIYELIVLYVHIYYMYTCCYTKMKLKFKLKDDI